LKKSKHQTKRADNARKAKDNRPHPALGYAPGNEELWINSKLCRLLITEDQVQKLSVPAVTLEMEPEIVRVKGLDLKVKYDFLNDGHETELTGRMVPKVVNGRAMVEEAETPTLYNYGVGPREVAMIENLAFARGLGRATRHEELQAQRRVRQLMDENPENQDEDEESSAKPLEEERMQEKQERNIGYWFGRLLDIKNASAQGLEFENKKRIVAAFSSQGKPHDPGLPEVQGRWAVLRM
jgi:small subunit ribosomal protein S15